MTEELPLVIRWDTFPLDINDPAQRFGLSRWNFFLKDRGARVRMGFWEVEDGAEVVGEIIGEITGHTADEVMIVLEGQLYVSSPGVPEQVAGQGDVIVARHGRETHVVAKGRARAFFVAYGSDPEEAERIMRGGEH